MQGEGEDKSGSGNGEWRSDGWWAALAGEVLHPVQMGIVEAFICIGLELCVRDFAEIINGVEPVHLDYHVGRLRKVGALDFAGFPYAGKGFMDQRYKLTPERYCGGGR